MSTFFVWCLLWSWGSVFPELVSCFDWGQVLLSISLDQLAQMLRPVCCMVQLRQTVHCSWTIASPVFRTWYELLYSYLLTVTPLFLIGEMVVPRTSSLMAFRLVHTAVELNNAALDFKPRLILILPPKCRATQPTGLHVWLLTSATHTNRSRAEVDGNISSCMVNHYMVTSQPGLWLKHTPIYTVCATNVNIIRTWDVLTPPQISPASFVQWFNNSPMHRMCSFLKSCYPKDLYVARRNWKPNHTHYGFIWQQCIKKSGCRLWESWLRLSTSLHEDSQLANMPPHSMCWERPCGKVSQKVC